MSGGAARGTKCVRWTGSRALIGVDDNATSGVRGRCYPRRRQAMADSDIAIEILKGIRGELRDFRNETHKNFAAVDRRFEGVEQRLGSVEQRLGGVEQRLEVMDERIELTNQRMDISNQ